jgi:hypothetical protein
MEAWALRQGMPRDLVRVVTDEAGPVEVAQIKRAIREIVELAAVDQLVVYFAGHGVNIRYGEYWLLSGAPEDPDAAVNVDGSMALARHCGIPHIVLISDACRTAAEGVQAQGVRGSELFPNYGADGLERAVDVFFACSLGKPAYEVRDPAESAGAFRAVYTDLLVNALDGQHVELLDEDIEQGERYGVVRPWPLKRHLQTAVPHRLSETAVGAIWQTPDARIGSDEHAWLSRLQLPSDFGSGRRDVVVGQPDGSLPAVAEALLRDALASGSVWVDPWRPSGPIEQLLQNALRWLAEPADPQALDVACGFAVRGGRLAYAQCAATGAEATIRGPDLVSVDGLRGPAVSVLLGFDDGNAAVLPAISGFVATLRYHDSELVDVAYEPSARSPRRSTSLRRADERRELRALLAAAADLGVLRLDAHSADDLARRVRTPAGVDPTMALYAAYAYHELQDDRRNTGLLAELQEDIGVALFDVALLAGGRARQRLDAAVSVVPFVPMLSRGWAIFGIREVTLPPGFVGLDRYLLPSLWTLFSHTGAAMVRAAMAKGEVW